MSSPSAEVTAEILAGLLMATAPAGAESPDASAARERSLRAGLDAFHPRDMQELVFAAEILAAHCLAMARFRDVNHADPGSVAASRLLRDAGAAQRMLLAANRGLRLWRAAAAKAAGPSRKDSSPSIQATAETIAARASAPATAAPASPLPTPPRPAASGTQGVRPALPPRPPIRLDVRLPGLPGIGHAHPAPNVGGMVNGRAALCGSVAVPAR